MSLKWYAFFLMVYIASLVCFTIPTLAITLGFLVLFTCWATYEIATKIMAFMLVLVASLFVKAFQGMVSLAK